MQKTQEVLSKATGGKVGHLLPTRKLGKHGPQVTAIGYGCMGLVRMDQTESLLELSSQSVECVLWREEA